MTRFETRGKRCERRFLSGLERFGAARSVDVGVGRRWHVSIPGRVRLLSLRLLLALLSLGRWPSGHQTLHNFSECVRCSDAKTHASSKSPRIPGGFLTISCKSHTFEAVAGARRPFAHCDHFLDDCLRPDGQSKCPLSWSKMLPGTPGGGETSEPCAILVEEAPKCRD